MSDLGSVNLRLVETTQDAADLMSWLGEDRNRAKLGFDLETSGLKDFRDRIRLAQIGDTETGWAVPWQRWSGVIMEALNSYTGRIVGHNIQFDSRFMIRDTGQPWPWERTDDTMYMAHVDNPSRSKGLKPLTSMLVDRSAAAGQNALTHYMSDNKLDWSTIPVDNPYYWGYGAMDVVLTCRLAEILEPRIAPYREAYELEMATARICSEMALRGARVDLEYTRRKSAELRQFVADSRQWAKDTYDIKNFTSIPQMIAFFEKEGFVFTKTTAKGAPALDKEVLETIDHPAAVQLLKVRKYTKIASTYLDNFSEFSDDDGFVHADIWIAGTKTNRMSVTNPALQTLPKQDKIVRNSFVPRTSRLLISCDADQVELRLMAYFADDQGLKDAFLSDESFFVTVAEQALGEKIDKEVDPRYKMIKSSIYARLYGAGDEKIAHTAKVPVAKIKELNQAFDESYPGVQGVMKRVGREMQTLIANGESPFVTSQGGRKFPVEDDKPYVGVNYMIQSTAAEVFKRALVDLDDAGLSQYMLLPVHDEILMDVPAEQAEDIAQEMGKVMRDDERFGLPLTWSADVLPGAWGGRELNDA